MTVSDPITTSRSAREALARGLNALQSDPNIPSQLVELAAPIAQAMGALKQIEDSQGAQVQPHASVALDHVRTALAKLQSQPANHPAVATALESVAASLGQVHSLTQIAPAGAPAAAPAAAPPPAAQPAAAFAATVQAPQAPAPAAAPAAAAPAAGGGNLVNADLGAHSTTNFYKGLSGNDIIEHGGLFVATYVIPKIGTPVRLKVSLPGGYEFEADAIVKWSRDPSDASNDAPPGFGAQFTQVSADHKQLIMRYVRNREPLFYDDL